MTNLKRKLRELKLSFSKKLRSIFLKFAKKVALRKHTFLPTTLIRTRNSGSGGLLEVHSLMYDSDLEPVHIVTKYGGNGQVYSVSYPAILDYVEYKGMPTGGMEVN